MTSVDVLTLVAAVTGSCVVALVGWLVGVRAARWTAPTTRPSKMRHRSVTALIALGALAAAFLSPITSVLWVVLALNFLLGGRENIPFSTYPMFSRPSTTAWALRFEDCRGELIPIAKIGLAPHAMRKRFATEMRVARQRGISDIHAARHSAASVLAGLLEQRRPAGGLLAATPITIVLVEYSLDSGRPRMLKTPIMETSP
jgi:hypothetical protein